MPGEARVRRTIVLTPMIMALCAGVACGNPGGVSAGPTPASTALVRSETYGHGAAGWSATRTVNISMSDELRFEPAEIVVQPGEIVTFHISNTGRTVHELTIGGPNAQELHEYKMASMDMAEHGNGHDAGPSGTHHGDKAHKKYELRLKQRIAELDQVAAVSDSVHVPPGESRDLTWAFTGTAPVLGCHIPGHWYGGMKGVIKFS